MTFAIGGIGLVAGRLGIDHTTSSAAFAQFALLRGLGSVNILLGFLNLVPSLPWDGGNALRAILTHRMSEFKATRAVAHLGLILCPALFVYGLVVDRAFIEIFAFVGVVASYTTLAQTGGIRFGEVFADRRSRKELEEIKRREEQKAEIFREDVHARQREREERERLRLLFERSGIDADESPR